MTHAPQQIGDYHLLQPVSQQPHWFFARAGADASTYWLLALPFGEGDLEQFADNPPSLDLAVAHASVSHPNLTSLTEPAFVDDHLCVAATLPPGQCLASNATGLETVSDIDTLVQQVSAAVAAMHAVGIVHGDVTTTNIYWDASAGATLLRNPLFPPHSTDPAADVLAIAKLAFSLLAAAAKREGAGSSSHAAAVRLREALKSSTFGTVERWLEQWREIISADDKRSAEAKPQRAARPAPDRDATTRPAASIDAAAAETPAAKKLAPAEPAPFPGSSSALITGSSEALAKKSQPVETLPVRPKRRVVKKKGKPVWLIPAIVAATVPLALLLTFKLMRQETRYLTDEEVRQLNAAAERRDNRVASRSATGGAGDRDAAAALTPASQSNAVISTDPLAAAFQVVSDSPQHAWVPPLPPSAIAVQNLPPGLQAVVHLRPRQMSAHPQWLEILTLLQDNFGINVPVDVPAEVDIRQVAEATVGLYPTASGWPAMAVNLSFDDQYRPDLAIDSWETVSWEGPAAKRSNLSDAVAAVAIIDTAGKPERLIVGEPSKIDEMIEFNGQMPPLPSGLQSLLESGSDDYDFSLIANTSLLTGGGRSPLTDYLPRLYDDLRTELPRQAETVALSIHLENRLYMELRLATRDTPAALAAQTAYVNKFGELPNQVEEELSSTPPHEYWSRVALRLPSQLRLMNRYLRSSVEGDQAILNCYQPSPALSNLTLGSYMLLRDRQRPTTALANQPAAKSIEELLQTNVTIRFEQESLESAARLIVSEFNASAGPLKQPLTIEVDGGALELAGITRNQQIRDFDASDVSLTDAMNQLVKKGNPVTTVQSLSEPDQKLVWMIADEDANKLTITTRTAAEAAGKLPAVFQTP